MFCIPSTSLFSATFGDLAAYVISYSMFSNLFGFQFWRAASFNYTGPINETQTGERNKGIQLEKSDIQRAVSSYNYAAVSSSSIHNGRELIKKWLNDLEND